MRLVYSDQAKNIHLSVLHACTHYYFDKIFASSEVCPNEIRESWKVCNDSLLMELTLEAVLHNMSYSGKFWQANNEKNPD